jgi:hypothetical protein
MNTDPGSSRPIHDILLEMTLSPIRQPQVFLIIIAYYKPILAVMCKVCKVYLSLYPRISTQWDLVLFLQTIL